MPATPKECTNIQDSMDNGGTPIDKCRTVMKENCAKGRNIYESVIKAGLESHDAFRKNCLNMIASENSVSPLARKALDSDLANRYTVGQVGNRLFPGIENFDPVEDKAVELVKLGLHAKYATVQPTSGMMANQVAYYALLNPGDRVLSVEGRHGGHYSHEKGVDGKGKAKRMLDFYGAEVEYLPFDPTEYNICVEQAKPVIEKFKPKLIIIGASEMLFPAPIRELRAVSGPETQILYDAAHVAGLIFGGQFQQPLEEGADMVSSSTNKSLGGVCHGMVAWNNEHYSPLVLDALKPLFTSNHHAQEVASVAITLAENFDYGHAYAEQVVRNSKALGQSLYDNGIDMIGAHKGFSESHMVLALLDEPSGPIVKRLAQANIICNTCPDPKAPDGAVETGLRIGTSELTRKGLTESEMAVVGELMARVIKDPSQVEEVKKEVQELVNAFPEQHFCFR